MMNMPIDSVNVVGNGQRDGRDHWLRISFIFLGRKTELTVKLFIIIDINVYS